MNKTHLLWYSYDFANSFAGIVLIFYFPLILIERGGAELWIGITSSIATAFMLLLLPRIGHYADTTGKGRKVIFLGTSFAVLMLIFSALVFTFAPAQLTTTVVALVLYGLFYLGYETALTVYSGLLRSLAQAEALPSVSGFGYAFGQVGNVLCLLLTNLFISTGVIFSGITGKPLGLVIGGVLALIGTAPFIWSLPTITQNTNKPNTFSFTRLVQIVRGDKRLLTFLVIMMLLYDTILTFQLYISSYLKVVFNFTDSLVLYGGVIGLSFGIIGAASGGFLAKKVGSSTRTLMFSTLLYTMCAILMTLTSGTPSKIFLLLAFSGIAYGLVFSLGRALYALLIPKDAPHEYFGIYTAFERMAAVIGPLVWTVTFLCASSYGNVIQYRFSVFGLALVSLCAFCLLFYFDRKYSFL